MDLGQTRVAVFYQDDAYGQSGLRELESIAVPYGLDLAARVRYDKTPGRVDASVREAARQVLAAAPQAVIMIAVGEPACSFMQQLRNGGYDSSIYSLSFASPQRTVERLGKEPARGIAFAQAFPALDSQGSPLIREYQALRARYTPDLPASYFSLEGFINAKVLVEAIRRAGPDPTRAKVLAALNAFGKYDLGKFIVSLAADDRQGSRFFDLTVLDREGRLVH